MQLDPLFKPKSIAIIGASDKPTIGKRLICSLDRIGFTGSIFPINPSYSTVAGRKCYGNIGELPEVPDVAAFCVGYQRILDPLVAAAERGVRGAVIYDGGFAERGEEGRRLQAKVEGICRDARMALCGPNCMGVLSPHHRSTTYLQELRDPAGLPGNVGIVSQSGAFCISLVTDIRRFGFSHVVSSGNEAVLVAADYLEYLVDDPNTKVIGGFIETIRSPERFVAALDRAAAQGKPVVVLKVGRTERTRHAVTTHTGGLAGDSRLASELLRAHRAIEVSDLVEFTEVLAASQGAKRAAGCRIGVITSSGGLAELILDTAAPVGLQLPPLSAAAKAEIEGEIGFVSGHAALHGGLGIQAGQQRVHECFGTNHVGRGTLDHRHIGPMLPKVCANVMRRIIGAEDYALPAAVSGSRSEPARMTQLASKAVGPFDSGDIGHT